MALDTSIYHSLPEPAQLNIADAMNKGLNLRKLMTEVDYQPQVLQQQLASARAAEEATLEGTRKAAQERENEAEKLGAMRAWSALGKQHIDPKTGKIDHSKWYEAGLQAGLRADVVGPLRTTAQTIRESDLKDVETRHEAKQKLLRQLDMEVAKSRGVEDTKGLVSTKLKELAKLGMSPEETQQLLADRYGADINQVPTQAQARLQAEVTPLKAADVAIAQGQLAVSQGQLGLSQTQFTTGVGGQLANITTAADEMAQGQKDLKTLLKVFPGQFGKGNAVSAAVAEKFIKTPEGARVKRLLDDYNTRNGTDKSIMSEGLDGLEALFKQEEAKMRAQAVPLQRATGGPAPKPGTEKPTNKPTGTVRLWSPDGKTSYNIPVDKVEDMKRRFGLKE